MDRLTSLAFFVHLAEKGGVAAAGRDFGMSPATASETLKNLEAHYGVRLLNRSTRSISLTSEGGVLLEGARQVLSVAKALEENLKKGAENLSGPIRISVPHDFGGQKIMPLIDRFMDMNPAVTVSIFFTDGYLNVIEEGVDLAFRFGELKDSSLIARKLSDNRRIVCASPAYLEKHGTPLHPEDLSAHNCLVMRFSAVLDNGWSFFVRGKEKTFLVSGNRIANSGAQVKRWCLCGRGVALKSILDVEDDLKNGYLKRILEAYEPSGRSALQIVYARGGPLPRRVRNMIDFFIAAFHASSEAS